MTNFELHYLISEYVGHISSTYQGWFAASSAVLLVSHYIGRQLNHSLRIIIVIAYLFYSVICYLGLVKFSYAISEYSEQIKKLGDIPLPMVPYVDISNGFLLFYLFIGGTAVVAGYFLRSTSAAGTPH